jgi:DNA-binding IclR family transcriptional regulator
VCHTLRSAGILHRHQDTGRYLLGHRLYTLAQYTEEARLASVAEPYLVDLVAKAEESSYLMTMRGGSVFCIKAAYAQHSLQAGWVVGHMLPALRAASGRAILASFRSDQLSAWWTEHGDYRPRPDIFPADAFEPPTLTRLRRVPGNIKTLRGLIREGSKVRARGFAISSGELSPGRVDAASVIWVAGGRVVGALEAEGLHYALIGGFAMALRGVQRTTVDLDFILMLEDMARADEILRDAGYRRVFHSENVSHYESADQTWGRIDILHAFQSLEMIGSVYAHTLADKL